MLLQNRYTTKTWQQAVVGTTVTVNCQTGKTRDGRCWLEQRPPRAPRPLALSRERPSVMQRLLPRGGPAAALAGEQPRARPSLHRSSCAGVGSAGARSQRRHGSVIVRAGPAGPESSPLDAGGASRAVLSLCEAMNECRVPALLDYLPAQRIEAREPAGPVGHDTVKACSGPRVQCSSDKRTRLIKYHKMHLLLF